MADRSLDIGYCRAQFPGLRDDFAYLENAGGSLVPLPVIERMSAFMRESQVQPCWAFPTSKRANERLEESMAAMAGLVSAEADEILIGPSTTLNVYVLAQALRPLFRAGDEIVVTNQDHEANSGAWRRLEEFGLVIKEWKIDPVTGDLDPSELDAILSDRTRLVCFPHCSNIVGTVNDVRAVADKARAVGALVCVDGVAFAAHRAIDLRALDVDFYLLSLYKLYGPHLALLYARRELQPRLVNQNHFFKAEEGIVRLNPGGQNYESVASLSGIVSYLDGVHRHHARVPLNDGRARIDDVFRRFAAQESALSSRFLSYIENREDIRLIGKGAAEISRRLPTFSFLLQGYAPEAVAAAAARAGIGVGHGHFYAYRCIEALGIGPESGVVRASFVHYNTEMEVEQLIEVLETLR